MIRLLNSQPSMDKAYVEYAGLSTDDKPTDCATGSTFVEVDTGAIFLFDEVASEWHQIGG